MVSPLLALLVPALQITPASGVSLVLGTFDTPAADSVAVKRLYSADAFSNPASSRGLSATDGVLTLTTTLGSDSGKDYSAQAGIRVPLNPLWEPVDIRQASAINFRIKGSGAYSVKVSLGSDLYRGVAETVPIKVTTAWAAKTIPLLPTPAFSYQCWLDEDGCEEMDATTPEIIMDPAHPQYNDTSRNVAMSVRYLQFSIDRSWKTPTTWSAPAPGPTSLMIDDIVIEGIAEQSSPAEVGPRASHRPAFAARYHEGLLSLQGLDGYTSLEVRSLSGARVASLPLSGAVKIRLDRGAYQLVAHGEGKPALSRILVVAR
jgi:hypothetical protein